MKYDNIPLKMNFFCSVFIFLKKGDSVSAGDQVNFSCAIARVSP